MMAALVLGRNEPNRGISTCAQSGLQVAHGRKGEERAWQVGRGRAGDGQRLICLSSERKVIKTRRGPIGGAPSYKGARLLM